MLDQQALVVAIRAKTPVEPIGSKPTARVGALPCLLVAGREQTSLRGSLKRSFTPNL